MKSFLKNNFKYSFLIVVPIYGILFLYNLNDSEVHFLEIILPIFISIIIVFVIQISLRIFFLNKSTATLVSYYFIFFFFNFGYIYDFCIKYNIPILHQGRWLVLFLFLILPLFIFFVRKASERFKALLLNFLNINYLLLLTFTVSVAIYKQAFKKNASVNIFDTKINTSRNFNGNVYYIILDGYASENTSNDLHKINNNAFFDSLKSLGFVLPEISKANYSMTYLSLSSSLNMDYLDNLVPQKIGTYDNSTNELQNLIQYPAIFAKFKAKGYQVHNISSGWGPTSFINAANTNSSSLFLSPFYYQWAQFTIVRPLIQRMLYESRGKNIMHSFSELKKSVQNSRKNFVFSHILTPHRPYIFNEKGEVVTYDENDFSSYQSHISRYYAQVNFINNQILDVIKYIIQNSEIKPIIILQSDHGSDLYFENSYIKLSLNEPLRSNQIKERTENLNAIYLPYKTKNTTKEIAYLTPVNTFRLIFNEYFQDTLEYRNNKIFYSDYYHQFRFTQIKY